MKNRQKYLKNKQIEVNKNPVLKGVDLDKIEWCDDCKQWYISVDSCYCGLNNDDDEYNDEYKICPLCEDCIIDDDIEWNEVYKKRFDLVSGEEICINCFDSQEVQNEKVQ